MWQERSWGWVTIAMMCCKQITDGDSGIVTYLSENVIETSNNSGPVLSNLLKKYMLCTSLATPQG